MRKIKITARETIIDFSTGKPMDDNGLRALNGTLINAFYEIDDTESHEDIINKFEKDFPMVKGCNYQLEFFE